VIAILPNRQISSDGSPVDDTKTPRRTPPGLPEAKRDMSASTNLPTTSGYLSENSGFGLTSSPVPISSSSNIIGEYNKSPLPTLRPPVQRIDSKHGSIRSTFCSPHSSEGKSVLDPNAHISSSSHARDILPPGHSTDTRRLSEHSLTASYISDNGSVPNLGLTLPTARLGIPNDPRLAPIPGDYLQPTGHILDNPISDTPVVLDQTLVNFIKTMEQSESDWANFILSSGDGHEHGTNGGSEHMGLNGHGHGHIHGHGHGHGHGHVSGSVKGIGHDMGIYGDHVMEPGRSVVDDRRSGMDVDYGNNRKSHPYDRGS
jgi:hypothetical protein